MDEKLNTPIAPGVDDLALSPDDSPASNDVVVYYDVSGNQKVSDYTTFNNISSILTSIANLTYTGNEMIFATSASTFSNAPTSSFTRDFMSATNAAGAQSKLSLLPGTNIQAYNAALQSISADSAIANDGEILYYSSNVLARTATSSYVRTTVLPAANASALATAIGAISFTSSTDNAVTRWDGTGGAVQDSGVFISDTNDITGVNSLNTITSTELAQLANINTTTISATQWGYLGALDQALTTTSSPTFNALTLTSLASAAGTLTGTLNMSSNKITNLAAPTASGDATNKTYVDALAGTGVTVLEEALVATTAALSATYSANVLTSTVNEALVVDSTTISTLNTRVCVKDEATLPNNGVYELTQAGNGSTPWKLTRTSDFTTGPILKNSTVLIVNGSTNAARTYILSAAVTTVGTNDVVWQLFNTSIQAGSGLNSDGGSLNINASSNIGVNGSNQVDITGTLAISKGGTNASSFTGDKVVKVSSDGTSFESTSYDFDTVITDTNTKTLTNKTLNSSTNDITANALHDNSGGRISINNTADTLNHVLKVSSTSPLQAEWSAESTATDINGLTELTTAANDDEFLIYDLSATTNKKITLANIATAIPASLPSGITIVASSNGNYTTISAAITAVSAGATIVVYPGTYAENITVNKNVRIVGYPAAQNVIITGADTTSTRITLTSAVTSTTLRELTIQTPSSGTNYAVDCSATPANALVVLYTLVIQGGGAGHGIVASDLGTTAVIMALYHNGGTLGTFLEMNGSGNLLINEIICNVGAATDVYKQTAGNATIRSMAFQTSSLYSCADVFDISGGEFELTSLLIPDSTPATNILHISGENVNVSMSSVHLHASGFSILVDGGLTGTGSTLRINGEFEYEKTSFPSGWQTNASVNLLYIDEGILDDAGVKVEGSNFIVGSYLAPTESVFGEGDSSVVNMLCYTSTDVTDIAGATYVDVTNAAQTKADPTFTMFPALTSGAGLFIGNTTRKFYGVKIQLTTLITYGSGLVSWWYYNGSSWMEFSIMGTDADSPYSNNNNSVFGVSSEQVRFNYDTIDPNWATISVNGSSAYWVYVRIGRSIASTNYPNVYPANTNSITTSPVVQRIKLHTNRVEINKDGFTETFGSHQQTENIVLSQIITSGSAASNANVNVSPNVSLTIPESRYTGSSYSIQSYIVKSLDGIDTSRPVILTVWWMMHNTNTGVVELKAVLNRVQVGDTMNGSGTETNFYDFDNQSNAYVRTNITTNSDEIIQESKFITNISDIDLTASTVISIIRDADSSNTNDTNGGDIKIFNVNLTGVRWVL